jgi:hypothetical protein
VLRRWRNPSRVLACPGGPLLPSGFTIDQPLRTPMNFRHASCRRRSARPGAVRRAQSGAALRGVIVAAGLVAAVVLQLAGPRLQCRLADLVGIDAMAPSAAPAMHPAMPSCGSPSGANPAHPCKVATAAAGTAPVI